MQKNKRLEESRARWNKEGKRFYRREQTSYEGKKKVWEKWDELAEQAQDFYRAKAQQFHQDWG
ncbi:MAG TPA: hypothetical protein DHN29_24550 [Cytophagales bacterium]|nr:hypothetical protein [Cytophagales bacterium]|tara:strand:- start:605 stop:793 length:189 start_codon:yes stop_codon:yes gene_type:complete